MKKQHTTILTASLAGILLLGSLAAAGCRNSGSAATDDLTKVTLNEVAIPFSMHLSTWPSKTATSLKRASTSSWLPALEPTKP